MCFIENNLIDLKQLDKWEMTCMSMENKSFFFFKLTYTFEKSKTLFLKTTHLRKILFFI